MTKTKLQLKTKIIEYANYIVDNEKLSDTGVDLFKSIGTHLQKSNKQVLRFCMELLELFCENSPNCKLNEEDSKREFKCKFKESKNGSKRCYHSPNLIITDTRCKVTESKKGKTCRVFNLDKDFDDGIKYLRDKFIEFTDDSSPSDVNTLLSELNTKLSELENLTKVMEHDTKWDNYTDEYNYWLDRYVRYQGE